MLMLVVVAAVQARRSPSRRPNGRQPGLERLRFRLIFRLGEHCKHCRESVSTNSDNALFRQHTALADTVLTNTVLVSTALTTQFSTTQFSQNPVYRQINSDSG